MIYFLMLAISVMLLPRTHVNQQISRPGVLVISRIKIRCFFAFLVVFLVAALRYGVGTDYFFTYVPGFLALRDHPSTYNYYEFAFRWLNLLCIAFTDNYQSIFVATSLIVYGVLFFTICKWSSRPRISLLIYFCSSLFFNSLSNMRQAIAMVICYMALEYLLDRMKLSGGKLSPAQNKYRDQIKPLVEFYIIVILAFLFHSSAIVFTCVPFLLIIKRVQLRNHIIIAAIVAVVVIYLNYSGIANQILNFVISLVGRYDYYSSTYEMYWSFLAYNSAAYILMYAATLSSKMTDKDAQRGNIYINIQFLAVVIMMFSNIIPFAERLAKYFILCQCASVPYFLSKVSVSNTKLLIASAFVLLYIAWILFYIFSYGADACFPYHCVIFVKEMFQKAYFGF